VRRQCWFDATFPALSTSSPPPATRRAAVTRFCSVSCWPSWSTKGWPGAGGRPPKSSNSARIGWDNLSAHALVQPPRHGRRQQQACVAVSEPADDQLRQAGELVDIGGLADGEHHGDPLRQQAPRHERKCLRAGPIELLRIVDQAHERFHLGRLGQ
jgi:hypothetical protein